MSKTVRLRVNVIAEDAVTVLEVQHLLRDLLENAGVQHLAQPEAVDGEAQNDLLPKRGPRVFWQTSEVLQGTEREPAVVTRRPRAPK